uniref:C-SKI SMAD4-binding domain-containing protein n=1 Tax=Plectus sambesii TaxID=2011161 RepID=A0A914VLF0_9BILA
MSAAILKLPTCAQLSPMTAESKSLSVDRSQHDVLLNEILQMSQRAPGMLPPVQPTPVLMPADRSVTASERHDTLLAGETISCFVVGGEKRMCFPQIISQVLKDVSLPDVNKAFTELNIHCSVCSREQLETLKVTGVMPMAADSCGLITKTDAERLVHSLLYDRKPNRRRMMLNSDEPRKRAVAVVHDCFGGCQGSFLPDLYMNASSECIECSECQEVFAPDRFVVHSHSEGERSRTCHWGFDSANWRAYIRLPEDMYGEESALEKLNALKQKFHPAAQLSQLKRGAEKVSLGACLRFIVVVLVVRRVPPARALSYLTGHKFERRRLGANGRGAK